MKLRKKIGLLVLFSLLLSLVSPWQAEEAEAAPMPIPVRVAWQNPDGSAMAPADIPTVKVDLLRENTNVGSFQATGANLNHTFQNEWNKPDGSAYNYTVEESYNGGVQVGNGGTLLVNGQSYSVTVSGSPDPGFDVVNKLIAPPEKKVDIKVIKTWVGQTPSLPNGLSVKLYRNGTEVESFPLVATSNWEATFANQPRYDNAGNEYTYTVKEVDKTGNSIDNGGTAVITDFSTPAGVDINYTATITAPTLNAGEDPNNTLIHKTATITNTKQGGGVTPPPTPTPQTRTITVEKIWKDTNGATITTAPYPETSVTVELLQNGQSFVPARTVNITAANGWRGYFNNMPIKDAAGVVIDYSVREVGVVGNVYTGANGSEYDTTIAETESESFFEVTNKKRAGGPQAGQKRLTIQKTWSIAPSAAIEKVKVEVYGKTNQPVAVPILLGTVEVKRADNWVARIDVPLKNAAGEDYTTYSYKEVDENHGEIVLDGKVYRVVLTSNPNGVTVLNDEKVSSGYTSSSTLWPQNNNNNDQDKDKDKDKDKPNDNPNPPVDPGDQGNQDKPSDPATPDQPSQDTTKDKPTVPSTVKDKDKASSTELKVGKTVPKTGINH